MDPVTRGAGTRAGCPGPLFPIEPKLREEGKGRRGRRLRTRGSAPQASAAGALLLVAVLLAACTRAPQIDVSKSKGVIELPAGTVILHHELRLADNAKDLEIRGNPNGSTLEAAPDFQGRALISSKGARNLRLTAFRIIGKRSTNKSRPTLPPSDVSFASYYRENGILIESASHVTIRDVSFREIANYPVLVTASANVRIEGVRIEDSGSLAPGGHNNATGGILLEEGTHDFEVRRCEVRRVRGSAIWTHSNYRSPRNANGVIAQNTIEEVGRDAIQVGHATNVRVERNTGRRIGYPLEAVDMGGYAIPVAIDTAGNVDHASYLDNHFEEINGQCIDLDGFHDGEVRGNSCVSRGTYEQYPYAQYAIVFGNANPDMQPVNITIENNLIDGAGYGGIYLIGSGHTITGNRLLNLNRNRCTGDMTQARCNYAADQPDLLRSGIYLGKAAARPAETYGNRIAGNEVTGFGMDKWCIEGAPGLAIASNRIESNRCEPK
jgi:hypothetical protein